MFLSAVDSYCQQLYHSRLHFACPIYLLAFRLQSDNSGSSILDLGANCECQTRSKIQNARSTEIRTRTRTNTNPNGTEASGNARALRKQSKCGMIQEGEGHWPNSSENLQKARNLWVLRTPQNNKEEGARAKKLVTCGKRGPLGRGQSVPFSAQGAYCSAPEP